MSVCLGKGWPGDKLESRRNFIVFFRQNFVACKEIKVNTCTISPNVWTTASFSLLFAKWKHKGSLILFPKPLGWIATRCVWVAEVVCFVFSTGRMCGIGQFSVVSLWQSEDTFYPTQLRDPIFSSGLVAGAFTCWANSLAPKYVRLNWRLGTRSDCYFVMPPGWFWTHPLPASASQVLELQVRTTVPGLGSVSLYFQNMARSHSLAHGQWLVCLLRCKMKLHTCSKAPSSSYSSRCQGQQEKQETLQQWGDGSLHLAPPHYQVFTWVPSVSWRRECAL